MNSLSEVVTYGRVVRSSGNGIPTRIESDRIDVSFMARKLLDTLAGANIPHESLTVSPLQIARRHNMGEWKECGAVHTYSRDEDVTVALGNVDSQDVSRVAMEVLYHMAALHIPDGTRGISASGQNLNFDVTKITTEK